MRGAHLRSAVVADPDVAHLPGLNGVGKAVHERADAEDSEGEVDLVEVDRFELKATQTCD